MDQKSPMTTADIANPAREERVRTSPEPPARSDDRPAPRSHADADHAAALLLPDRANGFRTRWTDIQGGFVDEPKSAVQKADTLVAEVMKTLADGFAKERESLEQRWARGTEVSTEDLRVALQKYRAFFDRLLNV